MPENKINIETEDTIAEAKSLLADKDNLKMSARNLNFYYGENQALYNVSLDIEKNKVTALIGPSGCGKSTFLRTLNRMNETIPGTSLEGTVTLDGIDIYRDIKDVATLRTKVGMVFQKSNPFPKSVFENVAYGLKVNGITDKNLILEAVEETLKKAYLWEEVKDILNKNAYTLSGGQQQRLCIARALAVRPDVLLMDEPASALDPISTSKIEDLIGELKQNYTIVIVTHNMQQAARISDYTAFFYQGDLIEFGSTKNVFTKPLKKKTEDYVTGRFG
ncbi:MAG: phosphate ABC transporter ATP-binding protein [candidate division Zixibacteria bacterium 4484_95]|nr:MAG: phosphate ABC transporter ATP-binding protein [candidate division Zixibacteria bacterium 4484_95]